MTTAAPTPTHVRDLFDKFAFYRSAQPLLESLPHNPFHTVIEQVLSPAEVVVRGKRTIMLGSNNYLGLTRHPALAEAAKKAIDDFGVGMTGSRMANGTTTLHEALEHDLAKFTGRRHCIVFTTGHQANLGVIATLLGPQDIVVIDADSHASIYDACRLSGAQILRFRHNDPDDLARRLARLRGGGDVVERNVLVIVEGLYSVRGDVAPLDRIAEVTREAGAYLLVDDAHGFGVFGRNGRGVCEHFGVEDQVDFLTGTFSKSLAGVGGFCVSNHDVLPLLRLCARSYVFTASGAPANVASVRAALRIMETEPERRDRVHEAGRRLRDGLESLGYRVVPGAGPIVAIEAGAQERAIALWEGLMDGGVYTNLFVPPATPRAKCMLRTSVTAEHSPRIVDEALDVFERVGKRVGIL